MITTLLTVVAILLLLIILKRMDAMSNDTILSLLADIDSKIAGLSSRLDTINSQLTAEGGPAAAIDLSNLATKEDLNGLATQASVDAIKAEVDTIIADIGTVGEAVAAIPAVGVSSAPVDNKAGEVAA